MRRLVDDDVRSRLTQVEKRGLKKRNLRLPTAVEELTSRKSATDIPSLLERMKQKFPPLGQKATNAARCSAGNQYDFGRRRCGPARIDGCRRTTEIHRRIHPGDQPRGPIQPGLGLTVYNWARPRDLSHFEVSATIMPRSTGR